MRLQKNELISTSSWKALECNIGDFMKKKNLISRDHLMCQTSKMLKSVNIDNLPDGEGRSAGMRRAKLLLIIIEIILTTINIHIINNWLPPRQRMRRPKRAQNKARRTILSNSSWKMRSILSQNPKTSNSSLIWSDLLKLLGHYINVWTLW